MSSGLRDSDSDIHDNKHTESDFLEQRAQVHALTRGLTDPAIRYVDELVLHYEEELESLSWDVVSATTQGGSVFVYRVRGSKGSISRRTGL